jgi:hypothetical protein
MADGPVDWQGAVLPGGLISLAVAVSERAGATDGGITLVAASKGDAAFIIPAGRMADFLAVHADRLMFCQNAAWLHWRLLAHAGAAARDAGAERLLWQTSRECRLIDLPLLQQRADMVLSGTYKRPRPQPTYESTDPIKAAVLEAMSVLRRAATHPAIDESDHLGRWGRHSPRGPFGPLGIGIDVQAAIAFASPGSIVLSDGTLAELDARLRDVHVKASRVLGRSARECFEWAGDQIDTKANGILLARHEALRRWLEARFSELRDRHDRPLVPPLWEDQRISTLAAHWGAFVHAQPALRAWHDVWSCARMRLFLSSLLAGGESFDQLSFSATYDLLPRLTATQPPIDYWHRLQPGGLSPPAGRRWILAGIDALELRCLASICERHHPGGRLAALARQADDPDAAGELGLIGALTYVLLSDGTAPPVGVSKVAAPNRLTRLLLSAVSRLWSIEQVKVMLRSEVGSLSTADVEWLEKRLSHVLPELESYWYDASARPQTQRAWRPEQTLPSHGWRADYPASLPGRLGMPAIGSQARASEVLDLADAIMKAASFELAASGFSVVAVAGEDLVVETADEDAVPDVVRQTVRQAAERLMQGIPLPCRCEHIRHW